MKQLKELDFNLILVKDLGMEQIGGVRSDSGKPRFARFVLLKCQCGSEFKTRVDIGKRAKSCKSCSAKAAGIKHGDSRSRLYGIWTSMLYRAKDPDRKYYEDITACKEWHEFIQFKEWAIANGYTDKLELDRIDLSKGYAPYNCRWTTRKVQGRNTRKLFAHNTSGYRGVCHVKGSKKNQWKAYIKVSNNKIELGYYATVLEAAKAYDTYVIVNNLEHTINGVLYEQLQPTRTP